MKEIIIDSHAHLNFEAFKDDADDVIRKMLKNNVWAINVGSNYKTSKRAVEISERYREGIYAAVGLHPIHTTSDFTRKKENSGDEENESDFDYSRYKKLTLSKKVVAIGETGLDYYYKPKNKKKLEEFKKKQGDIFLKHLSLAKSLNLPVILHCRMAHQEFIEVLKSETSNLKISGVVHCFTGNWKQAQEYMNMGLYLGFNGIIFKMDLNEVIKKTPLDRILVETDCPYLIPPSIKEISRNEPSFIGHIVERIAAIKNTSEKKVEEIATQNAKKLFRIEQAKS